MRCTVALESVSSLLESSTKSIARNTSLGVFLLVGLFSSASVFAQVQNLTFGYAGADAGNWGGQNGAVIGPPDDTCANMGAVGKINLVSNFGFNIPETATITEVRAYTKAGAASAPIDPRIKAARTLGPPFCSSKSSIKAGTALRPTATSAAEALDLTQGCS